MNALIDLTGQRFNRLIVVGRDLRKRGKEILWKCKCNCGNSTLATAGDLKRPRGTQSCGCYRKEINAERGRHYATHGLTKSRVYKIWQGMHQRCYNPNAQSYELYGGRGIKVCKRWHGFEAFIADMGHPPSDRMTLDRFPNKDGDYKPSNCRWATLSEQNRNRRGQRNLKARGQVRHLKEWAEITGIPYYNLTYRQDVGWSPEAILSTPVRPYPGKRVAKSNPKGTQND